MSFRSFFHRSQTQRKVRRENRAYTGRRPRFETFEDRCLMSLTPPVSYAVDIGPLAVVAADFNNDGHLDPASANSSSSSVSALLGNAYGTFQSAQNFTTGEGPKSIAVGDFNGDGAMDL